MIGDGRAFGIGVRLRRRGARSPRNRRAPSGALLPLLAPTFLVTYGDSYLPFDYAGPLALSRELADADGVMAVFKNEGRWDTSNTVSPR